VPGSLGEDVSAQWLRDLLRRTCGFDPGCITDEDRLEDIGVYGMERLQVVSSIEALYDVHFPDDLVTALETVGDLTYYARLKIDQHPTEGVRR